jgi:diacylglycerol kinase family enzyme
VRRFLLINPRSGDDDPSPQDLAAAARGKGIDVHVLRKGEDAADLARASGAEIIGMAGGDGSLAPVAQVAIDLGAAFVCVPFGTRNHFARDLGMDRDDPLAALEAFVDGVERRVDVGRAGDRLFLNNVSLGVYAGLVHRREHHRRRGEALARLKGLAAVARHRHRLRARVNGTPLEARVILVGNNRYELSLFTLGERERLDQGALHLWAASGVLPTTWEEQVAPSFRIELAGAKAKAAIDGEPVELDSPFELSSRPGALRVLVPGRPSETSRSGGAMHDQPPATEKEQEQAQEGRQQEEEAMRGMEHQDPETQRERSGTEGND